MAADGDFEPLVEGSAKPVAQTRRHAGNVKVERYAFDMNAGDRHVGHGIRSLLSHSGVVSPAEGDTTLSFDLLLKLAPVKPIAPLSAALLRFRVHP